MAGHTQLSLLQIACTALQLLAAAAHAAASSRWNYTSTLFEKGTVISFDDTTQTLKVLFNASVLVTGDRIDTIFEDADDSNITVPPGTERVSAEGKIISPGFVDTHRHGWQTAYKTLGSNTTLAEYFDRYGEFTQASTLFTADDIYLGQVRLYLSTSSLLRATYFRLTKS